MGWTIPELNERMSAYEAAQKEILEQIDPWGPKRGDYRAAVIAWVTASCFSKTTPKFRKFLRMFDFCEKQEQTDEDIGQIFEQMAGVQNECRIRE